MRVALTLGTFDVPHIGHAFFLRECEKYGDHVVVGVNSDEFVERYKGKAPAFSFEERARAITLLGYYVEKNDGPGRDLIEKYKPEVIVIGMDWLYPDKDYLSQIDVTAEELDLMGTDLAFVATRIISATQIKSRLG